MKKTMTIVAAMLAVFMFFGCTSAPKREAGAEYTLTILHTNDHHGTTLSKSGVAGLAERATYVKSVRNQGKNVLVLDAGDINTGTALSNMFQAEPDIRAYNMIGYDAVTFGNHEFDGTLAKLQKQMEISEFPWISANVKQGKKYLGDAPYLIKDYEGFRVGIIGLTTLRTLVIASPDPSLTFVDEIETAQAMVTELRNKKKCDIIIVLGHLGDVLETETHNTSIKLAEKVQGIDLIIDGHSHSKFNEPKVVNGTPIVSANEWGKFVGTGVMTIKDGKVTGFNWKPIEIKSDVFAPDAEVLAMLKPYEDKANASLKEVVVQTTDEFIFGDKLSRKIETALGNLVSDSMVGYVRDIMKLPVDFGFTNGGNIRTNLPKGDVTRENILTVLPFENYVYILTLKGSDVVKFFEFVGSINQGAGAFPQVSKEVRYTITYNPDGTNGKISNITINGQPIDPNKTYKILANNYVAEGGDGYVVLKESIDTFNTSLLMSDVVIDYIQAQGGTIAPQIDGRITVIGGVATN